MKKIQFQLQTLLFHTKAFFKKSSSFCLEKLLKLIDWFFLKGNLTKKILLVFSTFFFLSCIYFAGIFLTLPRLLSMADYKPPLLTEVFDRNGDKIGEIFKQRRMLFNYEDMPNHLISAFVAAEDGEFFKHKGINYRAILRAFLANLKAGRKVQGGSTITQQVARSLLLSSKKTYTRKLKEVILALRMENVLSKQDILYIYLNQIYLGHGAYGIEMASRVYFRKSVTELNLAEAAILAGLPKAPSRFSPIFNPKRAKSRQTYVLTRMKEDSYISEEEFKTTLLQPVKVFVRETFNEVNPYYLETARRALLNYIDSKELLNNGLKVYTAMDLQKQIAAKLALRQGLEDLDKRQGFRGVKTNLKSKSEKQKFTENIKNDLKKILKTHLVIPGLEFQSSDSTKDNQESLRKFNESLDAVMKSFVVVDMTDEELKAAIDKNKKKLYGKVFKALVTKISEEGIDIKTVFGTKFLKLEDFDWAVPVENKEDQNFLNHPKEIFKINDVILVKVKLPSRSRNNKGIELTLYQEPKAEAALISFDLKTSDVIAIVGGYDFKRSQFNRAYQSKRQAGSIFKPLVYGAALERGYRPNSIITDLPLVFSDEEAEGQDVKFDEEESNLEEAWRPSNISNRFSGDILFRTALIRSLNIPTVKIIEKIGLKWVRFYVRRLGIFSDLNPDFTMALGSSSLTLYEIVKAFSVFPKQGKNIKPILIHKVQSATGDTLITNIGFDNFFNKEIEQTQKFVEEESIKWFPKLQEIKNSELALAKDANQNDPSRQEEDKQDWLSILKNKDGNQLIPAYNSYILNNFLEAAISDSEGTGRRARVLKRPLAGKTGTTNGYYDSWFVGHSPTIATGVWSGFDSERTLGKGETGSRVALPIWIDYMREAHKELPKEYFAIPDKIIFANIDGETGGLASSKTKKFINQAFVEGTEPNAVVESSSENEEQALEPVEDLPDSEEDESDFIKGGFSN